MSLSFLGKELHLQFQSSAREMTTQIQRFLYGDSLTSAGYTNSLKVQQQQGKNSMARIGLHRQQGYYPVNPSMPYALSRSHKYQSMPRVLNTYDIRQKYHCFQFPSACKMYNVHLRKIKLLFAESTTRPIVSCWKLWLPDWFPLLLVITGDL